MNIKLILCVACIFISFLGKAQALNNDKYSLIGVGIGLNIQQISDTNFSPLRQNGFMPNYSLVYEKSGANLFRFKLNYASGSLQSGENDLFTSSLYDGDIEITYLTNFTKKNELDWLTVGGSFKLAVDYIDWNDQDAFSYAASNGVFFHLGATKTFETAQIFSTNFSIPVLQYVSRPPYNGINETVIKNQDEPLNIIFDGILITPFDARSLNWNVQYSKQFNSRFGTRLNYDFLIQNIETEHSYETRTNHFSSSLIYLF